MSCNCTETTKCDMYNYLHEYPNEDDGETLSDIYFTTNEYKFYQICELLQAILFEQSNSDELIKNVKSGEFDATIVLIQALQHAEVGVVKWFVANKPELFLVDHMLDHAISSCTNSRRQLEFDQFWQHIHVQPKTLELILIVSNKTKKLRGMGIKDALRDECYDVIELLLKNNIVKFCEESAFYIAEIYDDEYGYDEESRVDRLQKILDKYT